MITLDFRDHERSISRYIQGQSEVIQCISEVGQHYASNRGYIHDIAIYLVAT